MLKNEAIHIHGGDVDRTARKYGLKAEEIIDFSANINPIGPSTKVISAIEEDIARIAHYPDPEAGDLKKELSRYLGLSPKNIIVGNGAMELIYLVCRALKPKRALFLTPTFCEYECALKSVGSEVSFIPLKSEGNFKLNIDEVMKHLDEVQMLFFV